MANATLVSTKENTAKVNALKKINQCKWVGNVTHATLTACLCAINLETTNSGWYKPAAVKVNGLTGIYMINQDGSLYCEARVIKEDENRFKIEWLSTSGWIEFENLYCQFIKNQ